MTRPAGRIVLDISSVARWVGPPVGMIRVEHELARHALGRPDRIALSFFDPSAATFRSVRPKFAPALIGWDAAIDAFGASGAPRSLLSRHPLMMALERRRLGASRGVAGAIAGMQRLIMFDGMPPPFADAAGRRCAVVAADLALGAPLELGPHDTVLSAGYDWFDKDPAAIGALRRTCGFRYAVVCYDLIPLLFPEFYAEHDVRVFDNYWKQTLPHTDRVICNSHRVADDLARYASAQQLPCPDIAVAPLGYRPLDASGQVGLPAGLEAGRFALFVSTLEPRKGHATLLAAWRRLAAAGVPQRHRFKLVFVGRRGWMVDDVLRALAESDGLSGTVRHLDRADDPTLGALYRAAAFCLYPSLYEGFGLPVIEAFSYGKAVLASTGGAVPETVAGLSPCLEPRDVGAWETLLRQWIEEPQARAPYEAQIRTSFRAMGWDEAAANLFAAAASDRG